MQISSLRNSYFFKLTIKILNTPRLNVCAKVENRLKTLLWQAHLKMNLYSLWVATVWYLLHRTLLLAHCSMKCYGKARRLLTCHLPDLYQRYCWNEIESGVSCRDSPFLDERENVQTWLSGWKNNSLLKNNTRSYLL